VESLLGVFLVGGAAVPLDEGTPESFRASVAGKCGSRLLLAPAGVSAPPGCARVEWDGWDARGAANAPHPAAWDPESTAEIIFTSGTTGDPKGVVLTHGNLASDFAPLEREYLRRESLIRAVGEIRFLSTLPLSHMFGQTMNVFLSLYMGFTIAFVPPRPREILEAARRVRPWGLFTVPRALDLLAAEVRRILREEGRLEKFERRQERWRNRHFLLQSLAFARLQRRLGWRFRLLVSGGAALPEPDQQFWERCGYLVVQGYGLTETAPVVSISNPFERRPGSVGKPLAFQEVRLGPGGEVLVRGPNVSRGYLGAERAVGDAGWLHTGDVGEFDAEGRLRIRGRIKDVIVTAEGENVYPADVEAALASVSGVREACVVGLPGGSGEKIHAALLLEVGADPSRCVTLANEKLQPRQRVRDHTVWPGEDFPRTPTGKIRKGIVRERILAGLAGGQAGSGAATTSGSVHRLIARVGRIGEQRLSSEARLAEDLGFGSLDLVELAASFEEEFGVSIPDEAMGAATVGDLERAAREALDRPVVPAARAAAPETAAQAVEGRPSEASRPDPGAPAGGSRQAAGRPGALRMPRWAVTLPVRLFRRVFLEAIVRPFVRFYARPVLEGRESLDGVAGPFLLICNHRSYLDTALFQVTLPFRLRGRVLPAMTTRYHRVWFGETPGSRLRWLVEGLQVRLLELLFGAWPLPETTGFRVSLNHAGELADAGWSPLIFPEGRHVPEGRIYPFRGGIGIFARDLRLPVIPACVEGTERVLPDRARWPRLGRTRIVLGAHLTFAHDADAAEVTRSLEDAVRRLHDRLAGSASPPGPGSAPR
jgi:long-chain acyl-CoA synthetase